MRGSLMAAAALVLCAGCRSHPRPANEDFRGENPGTVQTANRVAVEEGPEPSAATKSGPRSVPVGRWCHPLADSGRVEMTLREETIQFVTYLKEQSQVVLEGRYRVTGDGQLSGTITQTAVRGPNLNVETMGSHAFQLTYAWNGNDVTVTSFQGGGWDAEGKRNFQGTYRRIAQDPRQGQ